MNFLLLHGAIVYQRYVTYIHTYLPTYLPMSAKNDCDLHRSVKSRGYLTYIAYKIVYTLAVVVTQVAELSLPIPQVHGLNPYLLLSVEKTKINEKRPGMGH